MANTSDSIPSSEMRTAARRARLGRMISLFGLRVALLIVVLAAWEALSGRVIAEIWVSSPSLIGKRLWQLHQSGALYVHSGTTVWQAFVGLMCGLGIGVVIGLILSSLPRLAEVVDPFFMGLYSLPRIALAPLFIIWFGIGFFSKVVMVFSLVFFIFVLNTMNGLRQVDPDLVALMRTMRASPFYIFRRVKFPSLVPWIFAAIKISIGISLIGSVIGELLGANQGLGWYIEQSGGRLDTTGVFSGLVALMVVAVIANEIVKIIENYFLGAGRRTLQTTNV